MHCWLCFWRCAAPTPGHLSSFGNAPILQAGLPRFPSPGVAAQPHHLWQCVCDPHTVTKLWSPCLLHPHSQVQCLSDFCRQPHTVDQQLSPSSGHLVWCSCTAMSSACRVSAGVPTQSQGLQPLRPASWRSRPRLPASASRCLPPNTWRTYKQKVCYILRCAPPVVSLWKASSCSLAAASRTAIRGVAQEGACTAAFAFRQHPGYGLRASKHALHQQLTVQHHKLVVVGAAPARKAASPQQQQGQTVYPQDADGTISNGPCRSRQCEEAPHRTAWLQQVASVVDDGVPQQ